MGGGRGERGWQNGSIFLGQDEIREALLPSEDFSSVGGRAPVVEAEPVVPPPLHLNCVHSQVCTSKMNLSDEVDLEDYVSRPDKISDVDAVEIGKELARKHFIHHVFRENDFEDGSQNLYRFLEHDPAGPKYHNFRGSTNDGEPKSAAYTSDDRRRDDYARVAASEVFTTAASTTRASRPARSSGGTRTWRARRDLERVDVSAVPACERLPFFQNLHNAMAIHLCLAEQRSRPHELEGALLCSSS